MNIKDFVVASSVPDACSLISQLEDTGYVVAGGTSSVFNNSKTPKIAIDITKIPIRGIARNTDIFKIGACTTINDILKYKHPGWILDRVALQFANQQIRNISTIGGNIFKVFYWSDFPVAMQALDGFIKLAGERSNTIKISNAFHDHIAHKNSFKNSLLEYVEIPVIKKGMGFGYYKESRTAAGFSSATVAAFIKVDNNGIISDVRISVGAALPFPKRLFDIEEALKGKKADYSIIEYLNFDKLDNYNFSPRDGMGNDYCKHLIKVKTSDVIYEALQEALGGVFND